MVYSVLPFRLSAEARVFNLPVSEANQLIIFYANVIGNDALSPTAGISIAYNIVMSAFH
jgi:hypothetical protein